MRGLFIVFEGLDRSGKSTQVKHLSDYLHGICSVECVRFPDRSTVIGKLIDAHLQSHQTVDLHALHLLFSANRWEQKNHIEALLRKGTIVLADRYTASGLAYSVAQGLDRDWCTSADQGLPVPDLTVFLDISAEEAAMRRRYGHERMERLELQQKVRVSFLNQRNDQWLVIVGTCTEESIKQLVREKVEEMVMARLKEQTSHTPPPDQPQAAHPQTCPVQEPLNPRTSGRDPISEKLP